MNKRKGFTLIELLTVIAILAIILLIAAPIILNVLDSAKKNTFKNQVLLYVEGLKRQVALSSTNQSDMNIVLPSVGDSTLVNMSDIPMDQDTGINGSIRIENDNGKYKYILVDVSNDSYKVSKEVEATSLTINEIVKNGGTSSVPEESEEQEPPTYTIYTIGNSVTLKDGSVWYVIENSDSSKDTVTLFASQNIKKDVSGWATDTSEAMVFDKNNSNVYNNSPIKEFLDGDVKTYINNSLTISSGTSINSIRLITMDEICNIINVADSSNNCTTKTGILTSNYQNVPQWLYSTSYWTMTPYAYNFTNVYYVNSSSYLGNTLAHNGIVGARPVIVTNKSNIK